MYRYNLKSLGVPSSFKFGPCEVCGQDCTEVFYQTEERKYSEGWTQYNCKNLFGHEDCLKGKQK